MSWTILPSACSVSPPIFSQDRYIGHELTKRRCERGREGEEPHESHHETFIQVGHGYVSGGCCIRERSDIEGRRPTVRQGGAAAGGGFTARTGIGGCGTACRGTTRDGHAAKVGRSAKANELALAGDRRAKSRQHARNENSCAHAAGLTVC